MPTEVLLSMATTPMKSIHLYLRSMGVRHVSNHSLSRTSVEWQQVEQKSNCRPTVIPVCILFNNLPQRQVCGNTNSYYHGIVSCCMWWKKQSRQNHTWCCLTAASTAYKATVSVEGKEKRSPPSGRCAAIPPELFITAKVHHFHLQRQDSKTNLPRINQFAFFIKWLAVLLKELLRTKGSRGNYLQK